MKEIKFRAWEIKGKGFIAGFNMTNYHGYFNKGLKPGIFRYGTEWEDGEYILEQFTGLLDKNGKEIYEGDILMRDSVCVCAVKYKTVNGRFEAQGKLHTIHAHKFKLVIVIGNIHENPELREGLS